MAQQEALTLVVPVESARVDALEAVLRRMRDSPGENAYLSFGALDTCHFGRLVCMPDAVDLEGRPLEPKLILLADCDGPAERFLEALVDSAGDGIDQIFEHGRGYPALPASPAQRLDYLRQHRVETPANYVHRPGRTVSQIRHEAMLHDALQSFADGHDFSTLSSSQTRARMVDFVRREPSLQWAMEAPPAVPMKQRAKDAIDFVARPLGLLALSPVVVPLTVLVMIMVRLQELRDRSDHIRPSPEHLRRLTELEDFFAHNGYTAGGYVKRGALRQLVVRSVLPLVGYGTRHLFTRDSLAGVKTIHFARWIPLDGGRRVVFASNFDGSVESYNNDFIDLVGWGLNLVFSNGDGYPATRWLVFGGASYEEEFKDYLRRHQIPTPVWYSAYPELTAVNIERNAALRAGLRGDMTDDEAQEWLRLL